MRWWKKKQKAALDAAVAPTARPASKLIVEAVEPTYSFPAETSHFGGDPYAEAGDAWPTIDGRPYDFICQINLGECPVSPSAPFDLIVVFVCYKAVEEADFERACLVRAYAEPSAAKAIKLQRPEAIDEDDYSVAPCKVTAERTADYPVYFHEHPAIKAAASEFANPDSAYRAALRRLGYHNDDFSHVGGYPKWVHDNTLDDGNLVFLAQIEYEVPADNCIGDATPIYIAFSSSDPTKIETDVWQSH